MLRTYPKCSALTSCQCWGQWGRRICQTLSTRRPHLHSLRTRTGTATDPPLTGAADALPARAVQHALRLIPPTTASHCSVSFLPQMGFGKSSAYFPILHSAVLHHYSAPYRLFSLSIYFFCSSVSAIKRSMLLKHVGTIGLTRTLRNSCWTRHASMLLLLGQTERTEWHSPSCKEMQCTQRGISEDRPITLRA